jgi:coproporphyrinogen III oxidase
MDMEQYYTTLHHTVFRAFKLLDQSGNQAETHGVTFSAGTVESTVFRGSVLEKAATARIKLRTKNPETGEDTQFDVFQIKIYPRNPTIPILLFNMENRVTSEDNFGGFIDVAPVSTSREDLQYLSDGITALSDDYGINHENLRKRVFNMYKIDQWDSAINAAIGIRLELPAEQFSYISEAGLKWLERYFTIVDKRRNTSFTTDDDLAMNRVRSGILEFYMLKDMSFQIIQKLGVPLEVMAFVHFPPTLHY